MIPLLELIAAKQATAVIPPRRHRLAQRAYDKQRKDRNRIECLHQQNQMVAAAFSLAMTN